MFALYDRGEQLNTSLAAAEQLDCPTPIRQGHGEVVGETGHSSEHRPVRRMPSRGGSVFEPHFGNEF